MYFFSCNVLVRSKIGFLKGFVFFLTYLGRKFERSLGKYFSRFSLENHSSAVMYDVEKFPSWSSHCSCGN